VTPVLIEPIEGNPVPNGSQGRRRILVCTARYLPGFKSGGPIRSVANMIARLSPRYDFYVLTRDRDATDTSTYPGILPDQWHNAGNAKVLYCSTAGTAILRRAFREVRPGLILLNSFQEKFTVSAMLLRRLGTFGKTPIVLAPRGEFSPGAMEIKRTKKLIYRQAAKLLGLHGGLLWQATAAREKQELIEAAPAWRLDPDSIHIAHNISEARASDAPPMRKHAGTLKLVFISRISEKKNLHFLLEVLQKVEGRVELDIFGPVAEMDAAYWERSKALIDRMPANVAATYHGSLDHGGVPRVLSEHHFFVLPTRGENYCHAAVESFLNGTPVLLSDETPWNNLQEVKAGFDLPLNDPQGWVRAIQRCVDMEQADYVQYIEGTSAYRHRFSIESAVEQHVRLFEAALAGQ
jgi:glycosyltransferase involved in cell wall biosynthesis